MATPMKTADRATNERLLQAYVMGRQHGTKAAHDEWNGERVKHSNLNQITPYTPQLHSVAGGIQITAMESLLKKFLIFFLNF